LTEVQSTCAGAFGTMGIDAKVLGLAAQYYGLPGHEIEDVASKQLRDWFGPSNMPAALSEAIMVGQSGVLFPSGLASEEQWSFFTLPENRNAGTAHKYNEALDMLNPPEITGSLKTKLRIDPEIEGRLGDERHIKFALNNVINIIGELLRDPGFNYKINVVLRDAGNIHGWEHTDIIIKFPDEHYDDITGYWKSISMKVSNFYKSLLQNQECSEEIVKRIRKFIYIIVISEE
jgi:hypothetical protein